VSKKDQIGKDPHAEREAEKYSNPIPSREYILDYLGELGKPVNFSRLATLLELNPEQQTALSFRLKAMLRDGQLLQDRRGRYCLLDKVQLIAGRVDGHPDGFGFLIPDEGGQDLFLSHRQMQQVFHGDRVLVRKMSESTRGRVEAAIVEVIERNTHSVVGVFYQEQGVAWVEPDNRRLTQSIFIPADATNHAQQTEIVTVEITHQPTPRSQAIGRVTEILGAAMAPGMEIEVAIRAFNLPNHWPDEVVKEAAVFSAVTRTDYEGRKDLRDLPFVTIDGEDAQDFDDAVYAAPQPGHGWKLYVAIADVSHYVARNSALDSEATLRGNSVYFPERVIPMLPEALANDLCSLRPNQDRLVMVAEMTVDTEGKLTHYEFYPSVIHSKARLTYNQVAAMDVPASLQGNIKDLYALFERLMHQRHVRGTIDFELPETKIQFGTDKKIKKIVKAERNEAHRLIEECMLLANISAARFLEHHKIPALYRIHETPSAEKLKDLRDFIGHHGLQLGGGDKPRPSDYSKILAQVRAKPEFDVIQKVLLYSLSQAIYHPDNIGHFGLSFPAYTHFTSPIRRYPDLLVHRAIRHILEHGTPETFPYTARDMQRLGENASMTERRADEATRDVISWLKCEYMQQHVGDEFSGRITGVTHFGIFVELIELYVEGMVHVTSLKNDYYSFDAGRYTLRGERTGKNYTLGDPITVRVMQVDLHDRKVHFELVMPKVRKEPTKTKEKRRGK
jgi:ribonuclease R